ncbi:MAG TPA: S-methyl-5-thioribose-1-phosphate isomerase [Burkholderiaceae bacterium]|jgi:methylthioribose-1-phosphate isomerase|nr:S-methyl-5-thioribose-1-phosphate isomerase [Burkholderiaceae bacterium]
MNVHGVAYRSIWPIDRRAVGIIDQTRLPYEFRTLELTDWRTMVSAIASMQVRGAPLIGVAAAYGIALAANQDAGQSALEAASRQLLASRPTAVNLRWAVHRMREHLEALPPGERRVAAWAEADAIAQEDVAINRSIGAYGSALLAQVHARTGRPVNVLTHCNAGWIATVDYGTALSSVYLAYDAGVPLHVWVDETRPRNQGLLTAWELAAHGVPHTLIADNAGGHLMQHDQVDIVLVGADRVARDGDVCNKIGTYLKALAARESSVPFYAAVPSPTIDWQLADALREAPIEERDASELRVVHGLDEHGRRSSVELASPASAVANPAFDVTPAALVTGLITERGIVRPGELASIFPEAVAGR